MPPLSSENTGKIRRTRAFLEAHPDVWIRMYKKLTFAARIVGGEVVTWIWTEKVLANWWTRACDWLAENPGANIDESLTACWPESVDDEEAVEEPEAAPTAPG